MRKTLILALSFLGLFASAYLLWVYTSPSHPMVCLGTGCDVVRASDYANFDGVPLPLFGVAMYAALALLIFLGASGVEGLSRLVRYGVPIVSGIGFLISLYLTGIEAFVLHAYCAWCVLSALTVTSIFVLAAVETAHPAPMSPGSPGLRTCFSILVAALVLGTPAFYLLAHSGEAVYKLPAGSASAELLVKPGSHVTGDLQSPVTVVEFGDFQCPACGRAQPAVREVMQKYSGRVRFVFRQFPMVALHPQAVAAAEASECAARQGKFWLAVDFLYDHQRDLSSAALKRYGREMGLDPEGYSACLSSHATLAQVVSDAADGRALGVRGTPTFFVGHETYVGPPTAEQLSRMIDTELASQHFASTSPGQAGNGQSQPGGVFASPNSGGAIFTNAGSSATACNPDEQKQEQPTLIHTTETQQLFKGSAPKLFVDVRSPREFASGHVSGAVNVPVDDMVQRWSSLPKDRMLVLYESGMANTSDICAASRAAGRILLSHGFSHDLVKVYEEGFAGWQKAGLPVER